MARLVVALTGALIVAVMLTVTPAASEPPAPKRDFDATPYLGPMQLVDIGGRRLNMYCVGTGSPTVVLEAGLGDDMATWRYVQPALAHRTRVCAYDRAGMGFSDFADTPRDAIAVTSDLRRLLRIGGVRPPYLMVGSSVGGLYALMFAERYQRDLAGLLLVDPAEFHTEDFRAVAPEVATELAGVARQRATCRERVRRGPFRPDAPDYNLCVPDSNEVEAACAVGKPACALAKLRTAHRAGVDYIIDLDSEQRSWCTRTAAEVLSRLKPLGSLPLIVLTGAKTFEPMSGVPEEQRIAAEALWVQMHDRLAALSSDGRNIIVSDAGHVIQTDDPQAIISATGNILDRLKKR